MGPHMAGRVKGKVLMVAPNEPAGLDAIDGFREGFGKLDSRLIKDPILTDTAIAPGKNYYNNVMDRIRSAGPEAVFCSFVGPAAVEFVREFRAARLGARLYSPGFLTEGSVLTELGDDAGGVFTALNYSADLTNAANRVFAAAYRKAHGVSPTTYAMASYDAAQVLDKAIQLAGDNPTAAADQPDAGQSGPGRQPARYLAVQPVPYPAAEVVPARGTPGRPGALQRPDQRTDHSGLSNSQRPTSRCAARAQRAPTTQLRSSATQHLTLPPPFFSSRSSTSSGV